MAWAKDVFDISCLAGTASGGRNSPLTSDTLSMSVYAKKTICISFFVRSTIRLTILKQVSQITTP